MHSCSARHLALGPGIVPQTAGAQVCHLCASSLLGPRQRSVTVTASPLAVVCVKHLHDRLHNSSQLSDLCRKGVQQVLSSPQLRGSVECTVDVS
jgi:hypothetical protein